MEAGLLFKKNYMSMTSSLIQLDKVGPSFFLMIVLSKLLLLTIYISLVGVELFSPSNFIPTAVIFI